MESIVSADLNRCMHSKHQYLRSLLGEQHGALVEWIFGLFGVKF